MTVLPLALRNARLVAGLSQAALARQAGVSSGYVAMLERGQRNHPSLERAKALAKALGQPLEAFAYLPTYRPD